METQYKTLTEFAQEIDRRESAKLDLVVPANKMEMISDGLMAIQGREFNINKVAHGQIAEKLGIPKRYYDTMPQVGGLREYNVNAWLESNGKNYLTRTLDGDMRAMLSDRYKPLDNFMVLNSFLPVLNEAGQFSIKTSNLSETRMYLQVIFPKMEAAVTPGDIVQWGITLTNSEVGYGAVDISTMVWRLACSNGMIGSSVLRRHHVGARIGVKEEDYNLYADDTIQADMKAFQLKMRDTLKNATSEVEFHKQLDKMKEAAGDQITKPETTVKNVTKHFNMNESLSELILGNMVEEKNFTRWGLANGITALAHQIDETDRQYEVERLGNRLIDMGSKEWEGLVA